MSLISTIVRKALETGYLTVEAEELLRQQLQMTKYGLEYCDRITVLLLWLELSAIALLGRSRFWIELSAIDLRISISLLGAGKMPTLQENPLFVEQASCLFIKMIRQALKNVSTAFLAVALTLLAH
ncbi:MAG: hypothetical protein JGK23_21980 [Microcoleus sp. PH2017_19_SFW_U_A]|nr:hypothetical protein [Microcoleus sp. PH2017_19_SFW_U_A]